MRDLETALSTRLSSCPPYKHAEIRQQQERLGNFLESVMERLSKLDRLGDLFSKIVKYFFIFQKRMNALSQIMGQIEVPL